MFSKSCEYALRAVIHITRQSKLGNMVSLQEISIETDAPQAFMAKILQQLSRNDIVISVKGRHGGFKVDEIKMKIPLSRVVAVIDGENIFKGCGLGLKNCDAKNPCPMHHKFIRIREDLRKMLQGTTLEEVADDMNDMLSTFKR